MPRKQTRKNFLKTIFVASLLFCLILSPCAYAELSPAQAPSKDGADKTLEKAVFNTLKTPDMLKSYPFLKEVIAYGDPEEVKPFPDHALISEIHSDSRKLNFVFMYLQDPNYCDAAGCALSVFADSGKGYKLVFGGSVYAPIYILDGKDMVACTTNIKNKPSPEWWSLKTAWWSKTTPVFISNGGFVSTPPMTCPPPSTANGQH